MQFYSADIIPNYGLIYRTHCLFNKSQQRELKHMFSHHLEGAGNGCGNAVKEVTVEKASCTLQHGYAWKHLGGSSNKHLEPNQLDAEALLSFGEIQA